MTPLPIAYEIPGFILAAGAVALILSLKRGPKHLSALYALFACLLFSIGAAIFCLSYS